MGGLRSSGHSEASEPQKPSRPAVAVGVCDPACVYFVPGCGAVCRDLSSRSWVVARIARAAALPSTLITTLTTHKTQEHSRPHTPLPRCAYVWPRAHAQVLSESLRQFTHPALPFPYILASYAARQRSSRLCSLGGDWCFLSALLPKPSFVFAHDRRRRASSAHSHTHSHMSIGTYVRRRGPGSVVALPHIAVSSPPPLSRRCR